MNWNSRSGDLKVNRETRTHVFPQKCFSFFLFLSLTSGLTIVSLGSELHSCY